MGLICHAVVASILARIYSATKNIGSTPISPSKHRRSEEVRLAQVPPPQRVEERVLSDLTLGQT